MVYILNVLSDRRLIELLQNGSIGVIPTDTIYGVVCLASNKDAVSRLYELKSRDRKPGTVMAASVGQLIELGLKARYVKAMQQFWPNPISVIIPTGNDLEYLHQSKTSLACRVVKGPKELVNVLSIVGPLLTSSANLAGKPPADSVQMAQNYFGDKVDFYVDGGDLSGQKPSTLIRVVDDAVEVLRDGAIKVTETGEILE